MIYYDLFLLSESVFNGFVDVLLIAEKSLFGKKVPVRNGEVFYG